MNKESLEDVVAFNKLPDTIEKLEINRKYLEDEIGSLEFYFEAKAYLYKCKVIDDS